MIHIDSTCAALMCDSLPIPDNGRIIYSMDITSPYSYDTVATYICNTGFGINGGNVLRTCGGDGSSSIGTWTPSNGRIVYSSMIPPYNFGTTANTICDVGFGLVGDVTRVCTGTTSSINGFWTETAPTCEGEIITYFI